MKNQFPILILGIYLIIMSGSCTNASKNSIEMLSIDIVHTTSEDKQLFLRYKNLVEEQIYDSNSCYIKKGVISAYPPNRANKSSRQIIEFKVENILMNEIKDSIAILIVFRHALILDDNSLEDEISECSLMKAIVHKDNQLEFVCFPNNVWIYSDGNQVEQLLKKFKNLMINGGGYYINGEVNKKFIYQLFNESGAVLGNI